jgi:two-component system OmpR family sensor kinase
MFKTLYTRLALGLFVLLTAVGLVYFSISLYALRDYNTSLNQELNRNLAKNLVQDRKLIDRGRLDRQALKQLFSLYMSINPSIEIYLLDTDGRILSYSADPDKIKRNRVSMAPILALLGDEAAYPVLGDDPRSHDRQKVFSVTPVPSAEQPEGYLYVVLRGEEYDTAELLARGGHFVELSAWAVLISLAFGMLAGLAVFRLLTRRLTRLTGLVERFEHTDMNRPPRQTWGQQRPQVRDEIDYLGVTFDRMAQRIASQIEQLQEKDALRRQLVAQVSHDLRTPLAAMQGYVESLRIKRATLSDAEQERFLGIALDEGRRLSRLVDELFELAALEAREKQPQPEAFAPAELVHDVCHKHTPAAARRNISLRVSGSPSVPLAYGDLGMTERVLDNLIGNAIEYSPEGGEVELGMSVQGDHLRVCVNDSGPGIPAQELARIFDAFYRGDTRNASGHAGLGLAIAKRIMSLQNGSISAANRAGGGASFSILLPLQGAAPARPGAEPAGVTDS